MEPFSGIIAIVSSMTPLLIFRTSWESVETFMPSDAGTEHEAGKPRVPSIWTRHVRHAPIGFMSGSLQSCEMYVPDALTASSTDAPSGTATSLPLIDSVRVMAWLPESADFHLRGLA